LQSSQNKAQPLHIRKHHGKSDLKIGSKLVIVFDCEGNVHQDFVPPGEQLTSITMGKFHNIGGSKCIINHQHKGRNKTGLIHNENWLTQCLFRAVICGSLKKTQLFPLPSYSPDSTPCDFLFFLWI
jgi:hypothetical protein